MKLYRLSRAKYKDDISGKGAEIAGGRWNSKGIAILYTGENRALCVTEIAVHLPLSIVPKDYYLVTINIPDDSLIEEVKAENLPDNWRSFPHTKTTKSIGDNFVKRKDNLVLKVPSAVVQGEFNYLINPKHKDFVKVKIVRTEAFRFDKRLFER